MFGQNILPHHCVVAHMDGSVTLTPTKPDAETYINDEHVSKTTLLQDGMIIRFGLNHIFRFCDSRSDEVRAKKILNLKKNNFEIF